MGVARRDAHDTQVVAHLLAELTPEARRGWDDTESRTPGPVSSNLHERLHRRLGAVSRALRSTKPGMPIHAACCSLPDGRGVLIAGPTGTGKSTLAVVLGLRSGATLVSDDTIWLSDHRATSLGAPVAVREGSPCWESARELWYAEEGARILVRPVDLGMPPIRTSARVDLLLFPRFEPGSSDLRAITPAEAFCHLAGSLLRSCTADEVDALAELAVRLPAAVARYADVDSSVDVCTRFFATAVEPAPVRPRRLDEAEVRRAGLCRDVQAMRFGGEVAMWRPPAPQVLWVSNWSEGTLWETPAAETLAANGFLERKES